MKTKLFTTVICSLMLLGLSCSSENEPNMSDNGKEQPVNLQEEEPDVPEEEDLEKRFYYGFDEKIEITQAKGKLLVKTKSLVEKSQYEQLAKKHVGNATIEWQGENLCKIELTDHGKLDEKIKALLADDEVVSVRPCYKTNDGLEFGLSDEIIIKCKQDIKNSDKEQILAKFSLRKAKSTKIYDCYLLSKDKDIISVANELYESGLFEFAYPNLICKAEFFGNP